MNNYSVHSLRLWFHNLINTYSSGAGLFSKGTGVNIAKFSRFLNSQPFVYFMHWSPARVEIFVVSHPVTEI